MRSVTEQAGADLAPLSLIPMQAGCSLRGFASIIPGVVRQGREAMINPFVRSVAPRLLACHRRHAPAGRDRLPDLPVKQARQRRAAYVDCEADLEVLDGDALLHTNFNPLNILVGPDRVG